MAILLVLFLIGIGGGVAYSRLAGDPVEADSPECDSCSARHQDRLRRN